MAGWDEIWCFPTCSISFSLYLLLFLLAFESNIPSHPIDTAHTRLEVGDRRGEERGSQEQSKRKGLSVEE
jgi:hypothetical protein